MTKFKLIWDFRGPNASKTAQHHEMHLKEYVQRENLNISLTGIENLNDMHTIAFLVVGEDSMKPLRDALKPHRGQIYNE